MINLLTKIRLFFSSLLYEIRPYTKYLDDAGIEKKFWTLEAAEAWQKDVPGYFFIFKWGELVKSGRVPKVEYELRKDLTGNTNQLIARKKVD